MNADLRRQLLEEAATVVTKDRNAAYEEPENSFRNIARLWNAYLAAKRDPEITPVDVAQMMILLKVARLTNNPSHYDSALDIAGYAACLADVASSGSGVDS
jgi:Domain of unknown function (DUF6378)